VKKLLSVSLLILFLFNVVGLFAFYLVFSFSHKSDVDQAMQNEKYIETIRIHKSELKNIVFKDKGKEFIFNGEMYDIKNKTTQGDYIVFKCINDKKEKKLLAGLFAQVDHNSNAATSSEKKQSADFYKSIKDLFLNHNTQHAAISNLLTYAPFLSSDYIYPPASMPSPPPEILFF